MIPKTIKRRARDGTALSIPIDKMLTPKRNSLIAKLTLQTKEEQQSKILKRFHRNVILPKVGRHPDRSVSLGAQKSRLL